MGRILINTESIKLEQVTEKNRRFPRYAILSHTWGDEEVTFQEMQSGDPPTWKEGYRKIVGTCKLALESGIPYAWVDTCCIDKSSSAELSEAINSMFGWYEQADICYAYLSDVPSIATGPDQLTKSRWFTRGWTLQELIAPGKVIFYSSCWDLIGSRDSLGDIISSRTGIAAKFLSDGFPMNELRLVSIAQRMSWASTRETTRKEDLAYCLLGIFGINMPLLYGEGQGAFIRLQEEIMRHSDDHTIFAWGLFSKGLSSTTREPQGLLAPAPELFARSDDVVAVETGESLPFSRTNRGIHIQLRVFEEGTTLYAVLHCRKGHAASLLAIPLRPFPGNVFRRNLAARPKWIMYTEWNSLSAIPMYLSTTAAPQKYQIPLESFLVKPLPRNVTWGGILGGYFDPSIGLITPIGGRMRTLVVQFRRLVRSPQEKTERQELISIFINVNPQKASLEERRFRFDYTVRYGETNPSGPHTKARPTQGRSWLATLERKVVFGQLAFVIEVHQAETTADAAYLMLLRVRMLIGHLVFWYFKTPIYSLEDAMPFLYWHLIVEFCLVRPAILFWLSFCFWPFVWVEREGFHSEFISNYGFLEFMFPRQLLCLATDSRLCLVWASILAVASYSREVKIAPRNARLAGLLFGALLALSFSPRDDRVVLFLGVVVSCWVFPVAERYHHHSGRRRRLGFYVGDNSQDQWRPSPSHQHNHLGLSVPRPGTAFG